MRGHESIALRIGPGGNIGAHSLGGAMFQLVAGSKDDLEFDSRKCASPSVATDRGDDRAFVPVRGSGTIPAQGPR